MYIVKACDDSELLTQLLLRGASSCFTGVASNDSVALTGTQVFAFDCGRRARHLGKGNDPQELAPCVYETVEKKLSHQPPENVSNASHGNDQGHDWLARC